MQPSIWVFFTLLAFGLAEMAEKLNPNAALVVDDTSPR